MHGNKDEFLLVHGSTGHGELVGIALELIKVILHGGSFTVKMNFGAYIMEMRARQRGVPMMEGEPHIRGMSVGNDLRENRVGE